MGSFSENLTEGVGAAILGLIGLALGRSTGVAKDGDGEAVVLGRINAGTGRDGLLEAYCATGAARGGGLRIPAGDAGNDGVAGEGVGAAAGLSG